VRRAIYRLVDVPAGDHDGMIIAWLWTGAWGVVSHESALFLHDLSDALPAKVHLTVPPPWKRRRLRVPRGITLHFAVVTDQERAWVGALPVTTVRRTLGDCLSAHVSVELLAQASAQAAARGLIRADEAIPATSLTLWRSRVGSSS